MDKHGESVKKKKISNSKIFVIFLITAAVVLAASAGICLTKISHYKTLHTNAIKEINSLEEELNLNKYDFKNISSKNKELQSEGKVFLADPTFDEAYSFLIEDNTDEKFSNNSSYICQHYSRNVNNNSEKKGFRCAFVEIETSTVKHALVAFNTTDKGLVFFEPQSDEPVNMQIGKKYWKECVISNSTETYPNGYIIENITIYW